MLYYIEEHHLAMLRVARDRLYTDQRLSGDEMRDMAQRLDCMIDGMLPVDLPGDNEKPASKSREPLSAEAAIKESQMTGKPVTLEWSSELSDYLRFSARSWVPTALHTAQFTGPRWEHDERPWTVLLVPAIDP